MVTGYWVTICTDGSCVCEEFDQSDYPGCDATNYHYWWRCARKSEKTHSLWWPGFPFYIPLPGEVIDFLFSYDAEYPDQHVTVFLPPELGGGQYSIPDIFGLIWGEATRRSAPDQEHIIDLQLLDSDLQGGSIYVPYFGETGPNILQYSQLSGTLDLNTGYVELTGSGTIVNDIFDSNNPIIVEETLQQGELNLDTGELLMTTAAVDSFPDLCDYIAGDCDHDGVPLALADVITMIGMYRGSMTPAYTCSCPPHGDNFAPEADPNGNCLAFELADVVAEIAAYRGTGIAEGCEDCPGQGGLAPGQDGPLDVPSLKSKVKINKGNMEE